MRVRGVADPIPTVFLSSFEFFTSFYDKLTRRYDGKSVYVNI